MKIFAGNVIKMDSFYLIKLERDLTEFEKELLFGTLNNIYDKGNKLKEFYKIEIEDLLKM